MSKESTLVPDSTSSRASPVPSNATFALTHSSSSLHPTHTSHSSERNSSGWQIWDNSANISAVNSANAVPFDDQFIRDTSYPLYTSSSRVEPRSWTDVPSAIPTGTNSQNFSAVSNAGHPMSTSNSGFHGQTLSSGALKGTGPHPLLEDQFSRAIREVTARVPDGLPSTESTQATTIPYGIPPAEYPYAFYPQSSEISFAFPAEGLYYPSPVASHFPPMSVYPTVPSGQVVSQRSHHPHSNPAFFFDYGPHTSTPYGYAPSAYPFSLGQPPLAPPAPPLLATSSTPDFQPSRHGRHTHSPRSHSESFNTSRRQPRQRSGTLPFNMGNEQHQLQSHRQARRNSGGRPRVMSAAKTPMLGLLRETKGQEWEMIDIQGHIVDFASDQYGSRFIQEKLELASANDIKLVYNEIVPSHALTLMLDVFGNYVIQKLLDYGTSQQRSVIVDTMKGHALELTLHMYGCRVIQKAIECISPEEHSNFVIELAPHIMQCVKDANGNHVVQRLIQYVEAERLTFLHAFKANIHDLASHPYGCRVLQRCLEHLPQDKTSSLVEGLQAFAEQLVQNQFGNYVMQYVLEHGRPQDRAGVINAIRASFLTLAMHKYASNVCEKALFCSSFQERQSLIEVILDPAGNETSNVSVLMRDQYGNYVLQKALQLVENEQKDRLFAAVRAVAAEIAHHPAGYTKNLQAIERMLEKYPAA